MSNLKVSYFREISERRIEELSYRGHNQMHFFPHRIYYVPKCAEDAFKLARRLCRERDPNKLWEVVLYATGPLIDEFPRELFFADDLIRCQQQFSRIVRIATASLVVDRKTLHITNYTSNLVQQVSRIRELKASIDSILTGWFNILLNGVMNFALENDIKKIYLPTLDLLVEHTGLLQGVQTEFFERVFDGLLNRCFQMMKEGKWWCIDVAKNRDGINILDKKQENMVEGKTICLCHDIERGLGHIDVDPNLTELANKSFLGNLDKMLMIEKEMNVKATYNLLASLFNEVREKIEKDGHCIAFHSYDHRIDEFSLCSKVFHKIGRLMFGRLKSKADFEHTGQLAKCRQIDHRVKGYRPPQSKLTPELSDRNLCFYNFQWLASWADSLRTTLPRMENRVVKIPILFDDYDMYKSKMKFEDWERKAIDMTKGNDFVAFCLHDCYGGYWLPHYQEFLEKIGGLGNFRTLDEVANKVTLGSCR